MPLSAVLGCSRRTKSSKYESFPEPLISPLAACLIPGGCRGPIVHLLALAPELDGFIASNSYNKDQYNGEEMVNQPNLIFLRDRVDEGVLLHL